MSGSRLRAAVAPATFVLLWATGFVVARLAMPHAPPLGFLALRFALALAVLGPWALVARARWPDRHAMLHLAVAGVLVQATYLGGVWCAVKLGMPAGLSALIVNLQPVLTALVAPWWLDERPGARGWAGLALGFGGVAMVVAHRFGDGSLPPAAIALCVMALVGITAGTLWQKRYVPVFDLRAGTFVQYAASLALVGPAALVLEDEAPRWHPDLLLALAWSVFALSIGAIFLMFALIRRGEATRVASLFYLVPPVTALMASVLFREPFGPVAAAGMAVTAAGVWLVQARPAPAPLPTGKR